MAMRIDGRASELASPGNAPPWGLLSGDVHVLTVFLLIVVVVPVLCQGTVYQLRSVTEPLKRRLRTAVPAETPECYFTRLP